MGTRNQGVDMNENTRAIKQLIDTCHRAHWDSLLLSCKTGLPHKFFPEIDFSQAATVALVEGYIALLRNPRATEVIHGE